MGFFAREWLLVAAALALLVTSVATRALPRLDGTDVEVLVILAALFVAVRGLELAGALKALAARLGGGRWLPVKLVMATFFLAMWVTNDAAIVSIVPLTLALKPRNAGALVTLEAMAANAGSCLTPFGNPQNLFIYWNYSLRFPEFVAAIYPLVLTFGVLLAGLSMCLSEEPSAPASQNTIVGKKALGHVGALVLTVLVILRWVPVWAIACVFVYSAVADRRSFGIDGWLLVTLACLFGVAHNANELLRHHVGTLSSVFGMSAGLSQVISNVPAALLLAPFTQHWQTLLWGVSVGGFGTLIASLASLIAYRLYVQDAAKRREPTLKFTALFLSAGLLAFLAGVGTYAAIGPSQAPSAHTERIHKDVLGAIAQLTPVPRSPQ